jgi:hypothetical protein
MAIVHVARFGQPVESVELDEADEQTLAAVLTKVDVDPEATIRFRGEQITGDYQVPVQDGETVVVAPPAVSHG